MKQIKLALLAVLCILLSIPAVADEDSNRTKVTIRNESFTGHTSEDVYRNLFYYVGIELQMSNSLIEIIHYGIGDVNIYLVDHHNQVVDQMTTLDGISMTYLDIPADPGYYTIVICSDTYYGEGSFTIE